MDWGGGSCTGHYSQELNRAYVAGYKAEDILNWRTSLVNGRPVLSLVVLREVVADSHSDDGFKCGEVEQLRVLRRVQAGPANRKASSRGRWVLSEGHHDQRANDIGVICLVPTNEMNWV